MSSVASHGHGAQQVKRAQSAVRITESLKPARYPTAAGESTMSEHGHDQLQSDNHGANPVPANTDAASDGHPGASHHSAPTRPRLTHQPSQHTQYVDMLLALDEIPKLHNILAAFFAWILLAGFILFPGTFTSLRLRDEAGDFDEVSSTIVGAINAIPLFVLGWVCCGIGVLGMVWLWWRWMNNYVWLVNRLFIPGTLNSLAGVLTTVANVFGVQSGQFSTSSLLILIVTGSATATFGTLALFFTFVLLRRVKKKHDVTVGKERAGRHGEGFVEQARRVVKQKEGEQMVM